MNTNPLYRSVGALLLLFLSVAALVIARELLVPIAIAYILSMLLLPLARRFEQKGMGRGLAAFCCIVILLLAVAGIVALLWWQLAGISEDMSGMQEKVTNFADQAKGFISNTLHISKEKQQQMMQDQQSSAGKNAGAAVMMVAGGLMNGLVNLVLVLVYMFLMLFFRQRFRNFVMKATPLSGREAADKIIEGSNKVSRQYLSGLAMMIGCLWVLYGIGFSIVGVKHAFFFAILCGLLEIVPFVGNLTGTGLTVLMVVTQGGSSGMIAGVIGTYLLIQFVQTYILEPLVVGSEVNINPFFTILAIVAGEMIWGIPGMILALPLTGVLKIVFDHIPSLQPYGYLIGEDKKPGKEGSFLKKVKGLFKKS